jgi:hypothetical protein
MLFVRGIIWGWPFSITFTKAKKKKLKFSLGGGSWAIVIELRKKEVAIIREIRRILGEKSKNILSSSQEGSYLSSNFQNRLVFVYDFFMAISQYQPFGNMSMKFRVSNQPS